MRETKFRGFTKNLDKNEWVYGDLICFSKDEIFILEQNQRHWDILHDGYEVELESVGQCTESKDYKGVEIYEGDIVSFGMPANKKFMEVFYCEKSACFKLKDNACKENDLLLDPLDAYMRWYGIQLEVVGNKYQNPELLEGKANA